MPRSLRRSSSFGVLAAVLSAVLSPAAAAPTREEIERSVKLREEWQYLTREIAWPAQWTPDPEPSRIARPLKAALRLRP
ncbi:hypothetical protein [Novosphingobium panipatense]|uniref:hypothetical protein n=1 Tax=Novosphingobium panipatense TaxID=428991 RepID=UPI0036119F1D